MAWKTTVGFDPGDPDLEELPIARRPDTLSRGDRGAWQDRWVPTVSRFFGIVIAMYFDDHGPPHFHARHPDGQAKIRIDTLEVLDNTLERRQLRLVLAWAELRQTELAEDWRLARAGETLRSIEPLR